MTMSDHDNLEKVNSTALMLPKDSTEKVRVVFNPCAQPLDRILIREDTFLGNINGCKSCGNVRFTCSGVKSSCSGLCWGRQSNTKYACIGVGLILAFVFSLVGTVVFCFTNIFNDTIISSMVLKNNSMAFNMWRQPPIRPLVKIHIFNYTNVEEVQADRTTKLRLKDVGPFVYQQDVERVNCVFNDDGTLTYQEKRHYTFRADLSTGHEYDRFVVPNLPYLIALSFARNMNGLVRASLNVPILSTSSHPFTHLSLHGFLWGYDDPLINLAKPILQLQGRLPFEKMGIMVSKNGIQRDRITIETGVNDINTLGVIRAINGEHTMNHWSTEECNRMDATDGSMFAPSTLDKKQTLHIYDKDLCRRLPFQYLKDVQLADDIPALRYVVPENVFDDPTHNTDNQCFCHIDSGVCPVRGIFNASPCAYDAPALVSFPHFYLGDKSLFEHLDGLDPSPDKHKMYLDIHPRLGFPLAAVSRIQINMQVRKALYVQGADFLEDLMILPIAWIEVNVEELPASLRALVYHGTYSAAAVQLTLSWGCALALVASTLALLVLFLVMLRQPPKPCALIKTTTMKLSQIPNIEVPVK